MQDLEMKKRVAQEIMDLMDQKEGERLQKHPKLMAAKIEVEKKPAALMVDDADPSDELMEKEDGEESELSPEMIQKLLEMMEEK